ncbi:hypothetical protein, partial [Streptomyces hebeiensis]
PASEPRVPPPLAPAPPALAAADPATGAEAIRLLRDQDAGRAALLVGEWEGAGDRAGEERRERAPDPGASGGGAVTGSGTDG